MYFRLILNNWTREAIQNFAFHDVKYLYTFSIEEFRNYFGLEEIRVDLHPSGCLYFCSRINEWGIYNCDGVPTNPVVSLATDSDGHLLLILHNNGDTPAVVFPFHGKKQEQDSSVKMVSRSERSWSERDRYLEESYMDAFEGDSDAYWNID